MKEVYDLLKDAADFTEKEVDERFKITEENGEWVLKAYRYLDGPTFGKILRAISERGGSYRKDETTKFAIFTLPKLAGLQKDQDEKVSSSQQVTTSIPEEGEYALSRSLKGKLGQLVPCLQDAEGMVIDGFHRLKVNPNAWIHKLDHIKTPVDRALARMTVNFCRRHYTSEEMKNDIGLLIGSGLTVEQIVEITGIGKTTIYAYMPPDTKDKVLSEAQKKGWKEKKEFPPAETPRKTQDTVTSTDIYKSYMLGLRECEKCGKQVERNKMHFIDNLLICPECAGKTKAPSKPPETPPKKAYKETGEYRKAMMHPQKSKFELAVIQDLQAEGLPLETDVEICAVKTIPDAVLRLQKGNIAIYIDNEATHPEGNGRDEFLRDKITQQGWKILPVRWKNNTAEERQTAKETIKEFLRW